MGRLVVGLKPVIEQDARRVRDPLVSAARHAFTASRKAGTHGAVRRRAVISSSSACVGEDCFLRRAIVIYLPTEYCHPERSEGSLQFLESQMPGFFASLRMTVVKCRDSSLRSE